MTQESKNEYNNCEKNRVIEQRRATDDERKADAREQYLLHQICIVNEYGQTSQNDFGKQGPRQDTRGEIDGVGELAICHAWQLCRQQGGEYQSIHEHLHKWSDDNPQTSQPASGKACLQLVADRREDEKPVAPSSK